MHSKRPKISIASNINSDTKYEIVRIAAKRLNWKITLSQKDWDILWQDSSITPKFLASLKLHQKTNHFPGIYEISRKNNLAQNLNYFQGLFLEEYSFFPDTFILPNDIRKIEDIINKSSTFIVKPEAKSQGKGIYLVNGVEQLKSFHGCVAQRYIENPLLISGLKFDLRVYVVVVSCDPLRIFINKEGIARLATEEYEAPEEENFEKRFVHLTNYAVNKGNSKFIQSQGVDDQKGHKRTISNVFQELSSQGIDCKKIWSNICDIAVKTIITIQPFLLDTYSRSTCDRGSDKCFEILGFDIIIDEHFKAWLLEVNFTPSFSIDSPLDLAVKEQVIADTLTIVWQKPFAEKQDSPLPKHRKVEPELPSASTKHLKPSLLCQIFPTIDKNQYLKYLKASEKYWTHKLKHPESYKISTIKSPRLQKITNRKVKAKNHFISTLTLENRQESPVRRRLLIKALEHELPQIRLDSQESQN